MSPTTHIITRNIKVSACNIVVNIVLLTAIIVPFERFSAKD